MTDPLPTSSHGPLGVMLCGHGSRDPDAVRQFHHMRDLLTKRLEGWDVDSGFLEFAKPVIWEGFEALRDRGAKHILALPGMLFAAGHVKNDVPSEINEFAQANPGLKIEMGKELGIDPKLINASVDRILASVKESGSQTSMEETLLVVVGRGTNDPDSNANISKVARLLWESTGAGWAEVAYSGVTTPLVDAALKRVTKLGYKRVIVFPYFLFTGVLVKRIYDWTDDAAKANPEIEFIKAGYLNDHPLVVETFAQRAFDILAGETAMNCQMCKYREQIVGFEGAVGQAQEGHHHHVRGAGVDGEHSHSHDHSHG